jgi:dienelactone hydrolase
MIRLIHVASAAISLILAVTAMSGARAQAEFPPPQGKGPVVVVVSGQGGATRMQPAAQKIAEFGYDVFLLDGNDIAGGRWQVLMAAIQQAQKSAHGRPGKVGVVGFSLGGGEALAYASRWADLVSVVVAWYPATSGIRDTTALIRALKVPVLMFAGESDTYKNCCVIATARAIGAAASAEHAPLELVTYPNTQHDFIFEGRDYNASATSDSWQRARSILEQYLGH